MKTTADHIRDALLNIRTEGSRRVIAINKEQERHRQAQRERRGERDGRFSAVLLRNIPVTLLLFAVAAWCFYATRLLLVEVEPSVGASITGAIHGAFGLLAVCTAVLRVAFEYLELNPVDRPGPDINALNEMYAKGPIDVE